MKTNIPIQRFRHSIPLWILLLTSSALAGPSLLTTITNPAPESGGGFGHAVAAMENGQLLVGMPGSNTGAEGAGEAYLFGSDGTLLTIFTNPSPASYENFGAAVAGGNDLVIIGTPGDHLIENYAGAVYLFDTNGTLLTTITNPAPSIYDAFGSSLAMLGSDKVIIGADYDSLGWLRNGAAYLYGIDGTLLTTITNPIPEPLLYEYFGCSVAAVGSDRILVGAYQSEPHGSEENAGVAYLFGTNAPYATLLTTFINPATGPSSGYNDHFGWSVAAAGDDLVIIGSPQDDTGSSSSVANIGAAHLFQIEGTLITTITNPVPEDRDHFGYSVAGIGSDRFLVGSPNFHAWATLGGAAYLFSADGTLLNAITNPTPAHADSFGWSMAAGNGQMLIGAYQDDAGAKDAGAAYLFQLDSLVPVPQLMIISTHAGEVRISWVPDTPGFVLQEQSNLASNNWINSPPGATNSAVIPATLPTRFYRLLKP